MRTNFILTMNFKTILQDGLQASLFEISNGELFSSGESRLRLALQSLYVVGASASDENTDLRQITFPADEGVVSIVAGKEFLLMVSASGKVLPSPTQNDAVIPMEIT